MATKPTEMLSPKPIFNRFAVEHYERLIDTWLTTKTKGQRQYKWDGLPTMDQLDMTELQRRYKAAGWQSVVLNAFDTVGTSITLVSPVYRGMEQAPSGNVVQRMTNAIREKEGE